MYANKLGKSLNVEAYIYKKRKLYDASYYTIILLLVDAS